MSSSFYYRYSSSSFQFSFKSGEHSVEFAGYGENVSWYAAGGYSTPQSQYDDSGRTVKGSVKRVKTQDKTCYSTPQGQSDGSGRTVSGSVKRVKNQDKTCNSKPQGQYVDIDWRVEGAVTRVKNQGNTCFCPAFATVDAVEALHFFNTGELLELSPQDLIDGYLEYQCLGNDHKDCKKNWKHHCFDYVIEHGIATLVDYPLKKNKGKYKETKGKRVYIDDYDQVTPGDEEEMLEALHYQPLFACMHITNDFKSYGPGGKIYDVKTPLDHITDHRVLIVGHVTRGEKRYWIIKNSYGEGWGDGGYMYVLRDGSYQGVGGINLNVLYPI